MTPQAGELFVRSLTASQASVYAYILTLVPDRNAAADILQETNVALWRNSDRFEPGTDFIAWACRTAHYQVMTWRKTQQRDRLRFDDDLLADLAGRLDRRMGELDDRLHALRACLGVLPQPQREALQDRYSGAESVQQIADRMRRPVKTVYQMLFRARAALAECIERRTAEGGER